MIQTSSTPLWLEILKIGTGPVIAAIVFIAGLLWRDRIERRNVAQSWFEEEYIAKGIDVAISHLAALRDRVSFARMLFPSEISIAPLSLEVQARLFTVLPNSGFWLAITTVEGIVMATTKPEGRLKLNYEEMREVRTFCEDLYEYAQNVRPHLLLRSVRRKTDVYAIGLDAAFLSEMQMLEETILHGARWDTSWKQILDKYAPRIAEQLKSDN